MGTRGKVVASAAAGGAVALLAFLLIDRWVLGSRVTVHFPPAAAGGDDLKLGRARRHAEVLARLVEAFSRRNGRPPAHLGELASPQPRGGEPLCEPDRLIDPWGGRFRLEEREGGRFYVFTTSPAGGVAGAFGRQP